MVYQLTTSLKIGYDHDNARLAWSGRLCDAYPRRIHPRLAQLGSRNVLGLPVEWNDLYVTNCIVVALGIAQAMLASTLPIAVLGYAGLEFINGVFMHAVPFVRKKGRFSPGLITAVFFFLPLSVTTFWFALSTGLTSIGDIALGLVIGALTLAFPFITLIVKSWPYFRQDHA